jgi:hypothetical protein
LEGLNKDDVKTPRIKLITPTNPEVRTFQGKAIPGQFWHTGMNIDLGASFQAVPIIVGKRVIIWSPRDGDDGGMLAFSRDAMNWQSGADKEFKVKIHKGTKEVTWRTRRNVKQSGLLEWGSYDPDDSNSPPAAQLSYEYLLYLIKHPDLSPVVMGTYRTALTNAKQLNTSLMNITRLGKPIQCCAINIFAEEKHEGKNVWSVPRFELAGWVPANVYKICAEMAEKYADYEIDYDNEDLAPTEKGEASETKEGEIPF